jgi:hypothetical protein
LKEKFTDFTINHTKINTKVECGRIFSKVINPIAYDNKKRGSERGRISKYPITFSMLMYNKENFRDIYVDKPKGLTRSEWENTRKKSINSNFLEYQASKAKKLLNKYNLKYRDGKSEVNDQFSAGLATQIHHIFPKNEFPTISAHVENLIALTPTQHFTKAHPNNDTHIVDLRYQEILLKTKTCQIKENIERDDRESIIYSFDNFVEVLSTGFNNDYEIEENDFIKVMEIIHDYYIEI